MPPTGGAGALPPTYVFEDLRGVLLDHVLREDLMLTGLAIDSLLFAGAAFGFARLLASARRAGTLLQMGE
jgi:ABC-2 type transport system permease protein